MDLKARKLSRRSVLAGLGATALLPILAACEPQIVEVEKEVVVTQIVEKEKIVEVEVVATPMRKEMVKLQSVALLDKSARRVDMTKLFNQAHEGEIEVEINNIEGQTQTQVLVTAIEAGSPPDVDLRLQIAFLGQFGNAGYLLGLDKYLAEAAFAKDIPTEILDQGRITPDGEVLFAPYEGFHSILYYNKKIFAEAGIKGPPTTTDEFWEVAKELSKPKENQYGYAVRGGPFGFQMWEGWLFAFGGDYFAPDREEILITSEESVEAAQRDIDFYKNGWTRPEAVTDGYAQILQGMQQGVFAMCNHGIHMRLGIQEALGDDLGYSHIPNGRREASWSFFNGPGIFQLSKHPDETWKYVEWYFQPEWQKAVTLESPDLERVPTSRALLDHPKVTDDEAFKWSMDALVNRYKATPYWHKNYNGAAQVEFHVGKQKAMLGEITAKEQMQRLADVLAGTMKPGT
jgi:multiple sugar transport system substrate-binding protein